MAKQQPAPKPDPDEEPERIVADPGRQESGTRDWPGPAPKDDRCG